MTVESTTRVPVAPLENGISDTVDDAVIAHLRTFFYDSRFVAPISNIAGTLVFVVVMQDRVERVRLVSWVGCMLVVSAGLFVVLNRPGMMMSSHKPGVSRTALAIHVASGIVWGLMPWLNLSAADASYRWIALCFVFAISTGTIAGITAMTSLSVGVLIPMWITAGVAMLVTGQYAIAVGCVIFAGLILNDNRASGRLLLELIRLRAASASVANRAEFEANHDALTGLPNRNGLQAIVDRIEGSGGHAATAMFIDLDHFKEVNDRFGHPIGDALLTEVGNRLRAAVRSDDVVGRLGGDEFLIVLFRDLSDAETTDLTDRIIDALEDPFQIADNDVYVSASIGVTRGREPRCDISLLVQESDKALYHAKRNGRRHAVVFDDRLRAHLSERSGLENELRKAVRSDQLEAWGQPVIDLATSEVMWVELLARWQPTSGTYVPPSIFIPIAEDIGVIGDLGRQMLRRGADALTRWATHPVLRTADVSVNISALHIVREDLVSDVSELVACHGLAAQRLVVELTESHRLTEVDSVASAFTKLCSLGVRLAIDDFGTGYSSFGQLLELPVSIVKIDRSLIAGCDHDNRRAGVVRAIQQLSKSLGHVVVSEGVETPAEHRAVIDLGIDQAQGYLFCPPLPLETLEQELASAGARRITR